MVRREDWPARLNALVEEVRHRPFALGSMDCCIFAADCVLAMTGEDPAGKLRGSYSTEGRAAVVLAEQPGGVEGLATRILGAPMAPGLAQRGDVVSVDTERGQALGVCLGARATFPGESGLVFVPMGQWLKAWRV